MIDVTAHDLETIKRILAARVPAAKVRAFGSRYRWTAKEYSDLDLAIVGQHPLTLAELGHLREDFAESDLPFRVDILDWHAISPEFQAVIEQGYEVIEIWDSDPSVNRGKTARADKQKYQVADLILKGILNIGDGYRAKNEELSTQGLPFARVSNINNGFHFANADHFPEQSLDRVGDKVSRAFDVVFTSKGTVGRFAFVQPEVPKFVYSPQLCFWRVLDQDIIDPRFLYYWMSSREFFLQVSSVKSQTDMADFVSLSDQRRMHISVPPIREQKSIGHILSSLDDKIELNRRMNETLEGIARALFKSWFVDFDPVRAKAEGRQPVGMDAETAALFPDGFEDSVLGEIPQGWQVTRLPEVIEVNPNRSLKKNVVAPYLDMANLPTQGHRAIQWIDRPYGSGTRFQNGDTLVARITPCLENGKTGFVDFFPDGQVGWGSTEYIILHPKPPLPVAFGYLLARSEEFRNYVIQNMTGTSGRQRAPASCLDTYLLVTPSEPIARRFGEIIPPIMQTIRAHDEQSRTLAALRDSLLPKLISGQLRLNSP